MASTPRVRPGDLLGNDAAPLWQALGETANLAEPAALDRVRRAHPQADPALVAAIATQIDLRRRALPRLGAWSQTAILDAEAVQQATRSEVARYRAESLRSRWVAAGHPSDLAPRIADLGCGIGADSHALAKAGFDVVAFERDPWRAEAARLNLAADGVTVICADVTSEGVDAIRDCDLAFVDPARRQQDGPRRIDGGRSRPASDPREWSPTWPWITHLAQRLPVAVKVAPGFDPRLAPPGSEVEWIDHDGDSVEATVWMHLGGADARTATAIGGGLIESITSTGYADPGPITEEVLDLLIEPSPGVIRAGLVGALARRLDAPRLETSTWLTADGIEQTPLARAWRVDAEVPSDPRALRDWLRPHGAVTFKTADIALSAQEWGTRVGHRPRRGARAVTIIMTGAPQGGRARRAGEDAPVGLGRAFAVTRAAVDPS